MNSPAQTDLDRLAGALVVLLRSWWLRRASRAEPEESFAGFADRDAPGTRCTRSPMRANVPSRGASH